jgi:hypothetical protein
VKKTGKTKPPLPGAFNEFLVQWFVGLFWDNWNFTALVFLENWIWSFFGYWLFV